MERERERSDVRSLDPMSLRSEREEETPDVVEAFRSALHKFDDALGNIPLGGCLLGNRQKEWLRNVHQTAALQRFATLLDAIA